MGKLADLLRAQRIILPEQQRKAMLALDREFVELEAKVKVLETEKLHLEAQVNPLKRQVQGLEDDIKRERTKKESKPSSVHLDETEIAIVKILAINMGGYTLHKIAIALETDPIRANVYLRKLEKKNFVRNVENWEGVHYFRLDPLGQEYAVENGFVS